MEQTIETISFLGVKKSKLKFFQLLNRGIGSGFILGMATSLSVIVWAKDNNHVMGSLVFPVGFIILVILEFELVTGNTCIVTVS